MCGSLSITLLYMFFFAIWFCFIWWLVYSCALVSRVHMWAWACTSIQFIHGSGFTLRTIVIAFYMNIHFNVFICSPYGCPSPSLHLSFFVHLFVCLFSFHLVHMENMVHFFLFISHIISNIRVCKEKMATIKTTRKCRRRKKDCGNSTTTTMKFQLNETLKQQLNNDINTDIHNTHKYISIYSFTYIRSQNSLVDALNCCSTLI